MSQHLPQIQIKKYCLSSKWCNGSVLQKSKTKQYETIKTTENTQDKEARTRLYHLTW